MTIKDGNLKDRWLVQVDLNYDTLTNEYLMRIKSEERTFRFGIPRHRIKDMIRNFNILIEKVDREYPE